jgi:hypothetical protein
MKTAAAARVDHHSARPAPGSGAEDSRVRMRPPLPPPNHDCEEPTSDTAEKSPDFVEFLCGRFELDRERGMDLLATLLKGYVASEPYPIHTLEPQRAQRAVHE